MRLCGFGLAPFAANVDLSPIHCKTEDAPALFKVLRGPAVLLTHTSDEPATEEMARSLPYGVRWFAQNCQTLRAEAVPIGLASRIWPHGNLDAFAAAEQIPRGERRLVYANFAIKTNRAERTAVWDRFHGESWVTAATGLPFIDYLADLRAHPFVLSPAGNGTDTHRTWESMLLGAIPIVRRHPAMRWFSDMPIAFCDDWSEVTPRWLDRQRRILEPPWNLERLMLGYWRERFKQHGL